MIVCPHCQTSVPEEAHFCPACGGSLQSQAEEEHASFVGRVLNQKYRLMEEIAEGGMAVVYKAEHIFLDDLCAVKIIKRSLASKDEMLKRFQREARLTRQVARRSPFVIAIYDFGVEDSVGFFYVMELLNGYPFTDILQQGVIPSPLKTARLTCQICEALSVVHDEGLVHRDIKPDNIFLHREEGQEEEMVKLLDFGIARPTYAKATMLTSYGRVMGTPEYMSPEQCRGPTPQQYERGESHLDGRSDIYALGVLLYQCLTGDVPFPMPPDGGPMAIHKVMAGHVMEQPISPIEKNPDLDIPPALAEVTLKALEKDVEDRFQTMIDFRDALIDCYPQLASEFRGASAESPPAGEIDTVPVISVGFSPQEESLANQLEPAPSVEEEANYADYPSGQFGDAFAGEDYNNAGNADYAGDANYGGENYDVSLDRTALDVQLPPDFLEQASKHWMEQQSQPVDEYQGSHVEAGGDWDGQEGDVVVDTMDGMVSDHMPDGGGGVDLGQTVTEAFPPEVMGELRRKAAEAMDLRGNGSADDPVPGFSDTIKPGTPHPLPQGMRDVQTGTIPNTKRPKRSALFWVGVVGLSGVLVVGVTLLVLYFAKVI